MADMALFDTNSLRYELSMFSFKRVQAYDVRKALEELVNAHMAVLEYGWGKRMTSERCCNAKAELDKALEMAGMMMENVRDHLDLQDVIDRIMLLNMSPSLREEYYQALCVGRRKAQA